MRSDRGKRATSVKDPARAKAPPAAKAKTAKAPAARTAAQAKVASPVKTGALRAKPRVTKSAAAKSAPSKTVKVTAASAKAGAVPVVTAAPLNVTIGCAGFPVPATRYFQEFLFVEVQDTHVALPGTGTLRRWRREAPAGFRFSMLAPREIGQEGFRDGKVVETALQSLSDVGKDLLAETAVFVAPPELGPSRANKAAVRDFLERVRPRFARVVWEAPPSWDAAEVASLAGEAGAIAARDPLATGLLEAAVAYYRLPGPAGHKSRYEDPAIEKLAALARSAGSQDATFVFSNVDMFADAKRLKKALKL